MDKKDGEKSGLRSEKILSPPVNEKPRPHLCTFNNENKLYLLGACLCTLPPHGGKAGNGVDKLEGVVTSRRPERYWRVRF